MRPGDSVNAIITRIEVYALYLDFDGEPIIVLVPDVRDEGPLHLPSEFRVGDVVSVRIVRYIQAHAIYKASMLKPSLD